ncbi:MAG: sulfotransferase [Desulfobacteraceae bacterium]|nr:sulfotransferase [Desulfobacteraceae bacterium]
MNKKLVFIVGLQKSGTSLLFRLLQQTGLTENPFDREGHDFWGDVPPFEPVKFPTGAIYQRSMGERGHEIGSEEATEEVKRVLYQRLERIKDQAAIMINKNPYNTVRLPWLKSLFPESVIVGVIRKPVSNVYSLMKKYVPHQGRGLPPQEGWWGVKPRGWRQLVLEEKVVQCARQWCAVNEKLWNDRTFLDLIVRYHELCETPVVNLRRLFEKIDATMLPLTNVQASIRCFDEEYEVGSRLRSKNRYYRELGSLETPDKEVIELPPFPEVDVERIKETCRSVAHHWGME